MVFYLRVWSISVVVVAGGVRLCGVLPVSLVCFCCSGGWGCETV